VCIDSESAKATDRSVWRSDKKGKAMDRPQRTSRVLCVLEVEVPLVHPWDWVKVTTSIPGRESALHKVWDTSTGRLTDSNYIDLCNWIDAALLDAFQTIGGIQRELRI
jgi:hypothetical protein